MANDDLGRHEEELLLLERILGIVPPPRPPVPPLTGAGGGGLGRHETPLDRVLRKALPPRGSAPAPEGDVFGPDVGAPGPHVEALIRAHERQEAAALGPAPAPTEEWSMVPSAPAEPGDGPRTIDELIDALERGPAAVTPPEPGDAGQYDTLRRPPAPSAPVEPGDGPRTIDELIDALERGPAAVTPLGPGDAGQYDTLRRAPAPSSPIEPGDGPRTIDELIDALERGPAAVTPLGPGDAGQYDTLRRAPAPSSPIEPGDGPRTIDELIDALERGPAAVTPLGPGDAGQYDTLRRAPAPSSPIEPGDGPRTIDELIDALERGPAAVTPLGPGDAGQYDTLRRAPAPSSPIEPGDGPRTIDELIDALERGPAAEPVAQYVRNPRYEPDQSRAGRPSGPLDLEGAPNLERGRAAGEPASLLARLPPVPLGAQGGFFSDRDGGASQQPASIAPATPQVGPPPDSTQYDTLDRRPRTHTIQPDEILGQIALDYGVSVEDLLAANPQIDDPGMIYKGNTLIIPRAEPAAAPAPDEAGGIRGFFDRLNDAVRGWGRGGQQPGPPPEMASAWEPAEGETGNMAIDAPDQALKAIGWMEGSVDELAEDSPRRVRNVDDLPERLTRGIRRDAPGWERIYLDWDPSDRRAKLTADNGLTKLFWDKDENGDRVPPTREEADAKFIEIHSPGGEFHGVVRNTLGADLFDRLSPNQRMALQSWAHQQGGPNFRNYFYVGTNQETKDGRALKEAIRTGDRNEISRLWYLVHPRRRQQELFLWFYGVPEHRSYPTGRLSPEPREFVIGIGQP